MKFRLHNQNQTQENNLLDALNDDGQGPSNTPSGLKVPTSPIFTTNEGSNISVINILYALSDEGYGPSYLPSGLGRKSW